VFVTVRADTVEIWDVGAEENCTSRFALIVSRRRDSVYVVRRDAVGPGSWCICQFDLLASVIDLPARSYRVVICRKKLTRYGYPLDTSQLIGEVPFQVVVQGTTNLLIGSVQSECYGPTAVGHQDSGLPTGFALHQN
jgi:hypothetical protein